MRHVAQDGEDQHARRQARAGVDHARDQGVPAMSRWGERMSARIVCFGIEGDPSACGLGYVDISSVSYRGYPEMELMST